MGLGPPILALYRQLKGLGAFDGIHSVMELGAQNVWCPRPELVKNLFRAFGKPQPAQDMLDRPPREETASRSCPLDVPAVL
jgi:hypothetical protein